MSLNHEDLGKMRAAGDIDGLVAVIESGDDKLRDTAAEMLGECGDARCVGPLMKMLREGRFGYIRGAAARALGQLRAAEAVSALEETLNDSIHYTRCGAARALGQIGDVRAVEPLIGMLKEEREEYVRWTAADALKKLGEKAVEALVRRVREDPGRGVELAVVVLGEIGDPRAIEALQELAQTHPEEYVRRTAARVAETTQGRQ